jgi:TM2 domain-containing membrane protein YozV
MTHKHTGGGAKAKAFISYTLIIGFIALVLYTGYWLFKINPII